MHLVHLSHADSICHLLTMAIKPLVPLLSVEFAKSFFQHLSVLELEKELLKHIFFGAILVGEIKVSQGTCQSYCYFRRMPDDLC